MDRARSQFVEGVCMNLARLLLREMRGLEMFLVVVDVREVGPDRDVLVCHSGEFDKQPRRTIRASDLTSCLVCQTADACTVSLNRYLNSSNALGTPGLDTTMTCSSS